MEPESDDVAIWRVLRENELRASINRPRTAHSSLGTGRMSPAPGSLSDLRDSDYRGLGVNLMARSSTASPGPGGLAPDHSLRSFRSETNLKMTLGARNLSSSSLALPPVRRFDGAAACDRPLTAHSMRGGSISSVGRGSLLADRPAPSLHLNLAAAAASDSALGGPPRSPLGQFELESPVKSEDSASLLGDEPDRIADGIKARLAREEEDAAKARAAEHERRWAQAAAASAAQRQRHAAERRVEVVRGAGVPAGMAAYPSPPSSIEGEHDVPTLSVPVPRSSPRLLTAAPLQQDARPASRGTDAKHARPVVHIPAPRAQTSPVDDDRSSSSSNSMRGQSPAAVEESVSSPKTPAQDSPTSSGPEPGRKERSSPGGGSTSGAQPLLKPNGDPRELTRGATPTAQAISSKAAAPRSPLFQQMSPFDVHSEEEDDDDDDDNGQAAVADCATNAPYGIPSPPLSHRTPPNDEDENEGLPVLRTVEAKRDTMVVGGPGRESLGLQIEEFEKSLQQAQAMSALEQGPVDARPGGAVVVDLQLATRSRAGSNCSSNYSDMSESPMTIEPPLVSPKPFPLSPRPMSPGGRLRASAAEAAVPAPPPPPPPQVLPTLEARPNSPFGRVRQQTAAIEAMRRKHAEDRLVESPADGAGKPLRPRVGTGAASPRRPTLGEYGGVKVNTVATLAGRVRRPSPDEYGIQIRPVDTPVRTASPFEIDAPCSNMESPILKKEEARPLMTFESPSEAHFEYYTTDSAATSRANSPVSSGTGSGSYSVFSPPQPPPARRHAPPAPAPAPARSVQAEWQFGPAPTAPPTSPLPIPERSAARRKNTLELAAQRRLEHQPLSPGPAAAAPPPSPGLASSASIVPDPDANPNWPLPGPNSPSLFPSTADSEASAAHGDSGSSSNNDDSGGGFAARRSLFRAGRAPPAPLNIAAARYADEISSFGGAGGPWTPDPAAVVVAVIPASGESGGNGSGARSATVDRTGFDFSGGGGEPTAAAATARQQQQQQQQHGVALLDAEDKSSAIGVARGLSIKYDRKRDVERRAARGQERARLRTGASAWRLEEEEDTAAPMSPMLPSSPTQGEPFDRLRRPNHGLRSPTGIADEQGIRFI